MGLLNDAVHLDGALWLAGVLVAIIVLLHPYISSVVGSCCPVALRERCLTPRVSFPGDHHQNWGVSQDGVSSLISFKLHEKYNRLDYKQLPSSYFVFEGLFTMDTENDVSHLLFSFQPELGELCILNY